jgi:hypothetical protein
VDWQRWAGQRVWSCRGRGRCCLLRDRYRGWRIWLRDAVGFRFGLWLRRA